MMRPEPADDHLIEVLRAESVSTYVQQVIARLDQERRKTRIAYSAVRHAVQHTHVASGGCSACDHIEAILETDF